MKIIITERQLNELMSLDNYDAKTFISNKLIEFLNKLLNLLVVDDGTISSDDSTEREITYKVTKVIIDSIIEFYELEDNKENRKKINSLFYVSTHIDASSIGDDDNPLTALWEDLFHIYIHINNKESNIYVKGSRSKKAQIFEDRIVERISKLIDELKKKYPEWVEGGEFKKEKILPYKNTPFQSDDKLSVGIYEWNVTFDTLEKLFYDFLFENLEDIEYEQYKTIIDRNMNRFKEYVEKDDYKKHIYYNKLAHKISKRMIKVLRQDKIYDKKYLYDYIYSLHNFGIEKKLFDKDFIDFLVMFRKFVMK
jgi:hypothetical protein